MIEPMLAHPYKEGKILDWTQWAAEEKYDGQRLIVLIGLPHSRLGNGKLFDNAEKEITAWTRPNENSKSDKTIIAANGSTMAERELPAHLVDALSGFPSGVYDGELTVSLDDATHTDVTRKDLEKYRKFVIFDLLRLDVDIKGNPSKNLTSTIELAYVYRRELLEKIFHITPKTEWVQLAMSMMLENEEHMMNICADVWRRGGEGLILKRLLARYQVNKRSWDFIKIKKKSHAALKVVGFLPTRGDVMNRGPFAIVELRDKEGNETTVKTRNDRELRNFQDRWDAMNEKRKKPLALTKENIDHYHPDIGRMLMIEFSRRTHTGGYQGPVIWDRWEDE